MDTDIAFTREYSKVSISIGNVKCTNQGSRLSKDKDIIYVYVGSKEFPKVSLTNLRIKVTSRFTYFGTSEH
jgi:hypothetical protein